jgi:hypothetical protein
MNHPQKVDQLSLAKIDKPPTPTGTAPNGVSYPDPAPAVGVFVKW